MNEELVDEIYAVLVERFGVGEICIKKHGKRSATSWKKFISLVLEAEYVDDVYHKLGLHYVSFSRYFSNNYKQLTLARNKRHFRNWLLSLISSKYCYSCHSIKKVNMFSKSNTTLEGLHSICKICDAIKSKEYSEINTSAVSNRAKVYYKTNKYTISEKRKAYRLMNLPLFRAASAKYRASKLQATPKWANQEKITRIYNECPEGSHVDHIVPLQGKLVCGLHCEFNLQHLTAAENFSKSNKFTPC